jgi:hypothetical protein
LWPATIYDTDLGIDILGKNLRRPTHQKPTEAPGQAKPQAAGQAPPPTTEPLCGRKNNPKMMSHISEPQMNYFALLVKDSVFVIGKEGQEWFLLIAAGVRARKSLRFVICE